MKTHFKMTVQYDGTRFSGWQKLPDNHTTIQETIEKVLENIFEQTITINASGRTDAGVHALEQVFDFKCTIVTPEKYTGTDFINQINSLLPDDIQILDSEIITGDFHSRLSAIKKTYEYRIDTRTPANVFNRKYAYPCNERIDVEAMRFAAKYLVGTMDYRSFTSDKTPSKSCIRTIEDITITDENNQLILSFTADGFLYNMVRILSGTLLEVGLHKIDAKNIPAILATKSRKEAGITLPPYGLFLMKVYY